MIGTRPADILRHLEPDETADGELIERFLSRDESAFAVLVRRHGPMILTVCRRITNHAQDAEDAFQAVFLILAKKAAVIRDRRRLGNWLYGVAVRVAQVARRSAARRRAREVQVVNAPEPFVLPGDPGAEIGRLLHEELAKLPAHFREAIVLCDLRGESRSEAARSLGIPEGTLSSRLAGGRKKLAERLARRGVALTAAAVPTVLVEGAATAALPDSLLAKTCGIVAAWQSGAMVPASVLRLTRGGNPMRTMLLVGAASLALTATGLVFAAERTDPPTPNDPPKAEQKPVTKEQPELAAAEEPKKEEPALGFGAPRLQIAEDTGLTEVQNLAWSPDGRRLVIMDRNQNGILCSFNDRISTVSMAYFSGLKPKDRLVGFSADGKQVITEMREYELVSGFHKLVFWEQGKEDPKPATPVDPVRTVNLESEPTYGYAFSADGKTFRTVAQEMRDGHIAKLSVREVNAETGKTIRTLLQVEGEFESSILSSDGKRLAAVKSDGADLYDIATGKKLTAAIPLPEAPPPAVALGKGPPPGGKNASIARESQRRRTSVALSSNGQVVFLSRGIDRPLLVNGETGKALPALEGAEMVMAFAGPGSFSADGRLVAVTGNRYAKIELGKSTGTMTDGSFLKIWDTQTGKLLRSWPVNNQIHVAFHPTRPILAVLEPNGTQTRLGLWDFSAEKK